VKINWKSSAKLLLKIVISVAALWWVFKKIDYKEVGSVISHANFFWLLVATVFFTASKVVSSFRLNEFFRCINVNISELNNWKLYLLGMFYNLFLPGGIGGDGYKIYVLNKKTDANAKTLFWAVLLDRLSGVIALFCLAVILFIFTPIDVPFRWLYIVLVPISLVCFWLVLKLFFKDYLKSMHKLNLQALGVQILQLISAICILAALHVHTQYPEFLFLFLASSIVATLPVTIGGIGSRELTFLYGAQYMHLDMHISISLSLLFYLITAFVSLTGIYYSFFPKKIEIDIKKY
jgi:glycosyltransferase 2 family protein